MIPLHDFEWHASAEFDFYFLWYDYSWNIGEADMDTDMVDGSALVLGTGCMPNCNFALINAHEGKVSPHAWSCARGLFIVTFCM